MKLYHSTSEDNARAIDRAGFLEGERALYPGGLEMYCVTFASYVRVRSEIARLRAELRKNPRVSVDPELWKLPIDKRRQLRKSAAQFGMMLGRDGRMILPESEQQG